MTKEEKLYDCITWYAIKNWKKLSKKHQIGKILDIVCQYQYS